MDLDELMLKLTDIRNRKTFPGDPLKVRVWDDSNNRFLDIYEITTGDKPEGAYYGEIHIEVF